MKGFLHAAAIMSYILLCPLYAQAQQHAGATDAEYGNIVVYLETAAWGQNMPYNKLCFTTNGAQAKTGCVPTAYAILMHYHKWPAKAKEQKVYHSGTGESITLGHVYDWDNMLDSYSNGYSDEEADAVATLMRDLGYAYQVEYGTGSTNSGGGGEGAAKLTEIFKYKSESPSIQSATMATSRDILNNDGLWVQYIKESLDAGCPIPYSSTTTGGGRHIFILDGYTDNGYFHFNWGWGGQGNGWFRLDNMKPDASSDYSKSHKAYFMLKPDVATYTISATVNDSNAGTATVNGESCVIVEDGTSITLQATANEGYRFVSWTLNGEMASNSSTYSCKATADAKYLATFKEKEQTPVSAEVTIRTETTAGGVATVNGKEETTVETGTAITLTASEGYGYMFKEWRVGTEIVSTEPLFSTIAYNDRTYTAVFEEIEGYVTIEAKGSGGYAYVGNGTDRKLTVPKGTSCMFKAAPGEGSGKKFAYWSTGNTVTSGKGEIFGNENPYEFTAKENLVLYVNFVPEETDLNVTIEAAETYGGTATVYGKQKQEIALGSRLIFEAKADKGYRFTCWTVGNVVVSTEPVYTTVAREAATVTANFEPLGKTGIESIDEGISLKQIYDLGGRKVKDTSMPGTYITNGRIIIDR